MPRADVKAKDVPSKPKRQPQERKKASVVAEDEKKHLAVSPHCEKLWKVLAECQRSVSCHNRGLQAVMKMMETLSFQDFMRAFIPALNRMLVVFKREPAIERLVKFVTLIATNQTTQRLDLRDQFLDYVLGYLVKRCDAKDKAIRFRCCQIIAAVLRGMDPDSEIVEDLFEDIEKRMLVCARDKLPVIRVQAIYALSRLQTDEDGSEVGNEYKRLLQTDSHKDCRRVVLGEIAMSPDVLLLVLQRTRDVSAEVRKQAFHVIMTKVQLTSLGLEHRNWLIKQGLQDRDEAVRKACSLLIQQWLITCDNDLIKLLGLFDVEIFTSETEMLATHVLKDIKKHDTRMPPFGNDLTSEMALYWRVLCNTFDQREVDTLLPDTVQLCQLLQDCNSPDQTFVLQQLLQIALFADLQDEAGRKQLEALYRTLLCSREISTDLIPFITKGLRKIYDRDETGYLRGVLEVISDIRDPVTGEEEEAAEGRQELENKFAVLCASIDNTQGEVQMYRELNKQAEVSKLQKQLLALQQEAALVELELSSSVYQDETTWARMLSLVADLLQHISALRGPSVTGLLTTTILPALQLGSESIQDIAIRCLGLYCSLDHATAQVHLPILLRVLREDDSLMLTHTALKAVLDLALIFDDVLEAKEEKEGKNPEAKEGLVDLVKSFLPKPGKDLGEGKDMALCAVEGCSKLLLFNKVPKHQCRDILTRLLVTFFDASTRHMESIRQYLTVFWLVYSQSGGMQLHNSLLADAFVPTLRMVTETSSLSKVLPSQVSQYMVGMLHTADAKSGLAQEQKRRQDRSKGFELDMKHGDSEEQGGSFLESVALELTYAILHQPDSSLCKAACNALSLMDFSRFKQPSIKVLAALLDQHSIQDKPSIKYLVKVLATLHKLADNEPLSSEEIKNMEEAKSAAFLEFDEVDVKPRGRRQPTRSRAPAKGSTRSARRKEEWNVSSEEEDVSEVDEEEEEEEESEEEESEEEESEEEESEEEESEEEESEEEKVPQRRQDRSLVKPLVRSSDDDDDDVASPVVVRTAAKVKPLERSASEESDEPVFRKGRKSSVEAKNVSDYKQPTRFRQEAKSAIASQKATKASSEEIESTDQESLQSDYED